jgi:hypothetical protein
VCTTPSTVSANAAVHVLVEIRRFIYRFEEVIRPVFHAVHSISSFRSRHTNNHWILPTLSFFPLSFIHLVLFNKPLTFDVHHNYTKYQQDHCQQEWCERSVQPPVLQDIEFSCMHTS